MEKTTIIEAKTLFGINFLGPEELRHMLIKMGLKSEIEYISAIPYTKEQLVDASQEGYILVYAIDKVDDISLDIKLFRDIFGIDPNKSEPCLYNQDWYMAEDFVHKPIKAGWHLILKEVLEDSRAVMPKDLKDRNIVFPTAILCTYTFFAYYYANDELLWYHDFVWCEDTDHNGDRIYVGKYHDIDGVNRNGFSIHRHLALRPCYGSICVR